MTYASTVLGDNPRHFWRLSDAGGQVRFDVGSTPLHMISSNGSAAYSGIADDGGSEFVNSNNGPVTRTGSLSTVHGSFEAWVFIWQAPSTIPGYLCAWDAVTAGDWLEVTLDGTNTPKAANGATVITGAALSIQTWHHLCATADGATLKLYVDGVLGPSAGSGALATITRQIGVGIRPNQSNSVFAHVAEAAIYDYALIGAQVANHFAAANTRNQPPIFKGGAALSLTTGGIIGVGQEPDVSAILASVRKTF